MLHFDDDGALGGGVAQRVKAPGFEPTLRPTEGVDPPLVKDEGEDIRSVIRLLHRQRHDVHTRRRLRESTPEDELLLRDLRHHIDVMNQRLDALERRAPVHEVALLAALAKSLRDVGGGSGV